jgi:LPXTG-motif cell wall-anchored protein
MRRALAALSVLLTMACIPAGAVAQSAGDQQYVDPFGGGEGGGGQEQPAQQEQPAAPEEPAPAEPAPAEPAPVDPAPSVPSEGGNGEAAGAVAPEASGPTLPRTGAPTLALLAAGAALTGVGVVLRRRL